MGRVFTIRSVGYGLARKYVVESNLQIHAVILARLKDKVCHRKTIIARIVEVKVFVKKIVALC
jgi:hypothetical protein